jgi:MOSC domain-containing protein YiiM
MWRSCLGGSDLGVVLAVAARNGHGLGKTPFATIMLVAGEGVDGDAHRGVTVKHRSRVAKDPSQPNLRQVHLIHSELLDELSSKGFSVKAGELGENVLTHGIDLLALPTGTLLLFPSGAQLEVTGLRNPCHQINGHTSGLMDALLDKADDGSLIRKGGIMAVVVVGGIVSTSDNIETRLPTEPWAALKPV